MCVVSKVDELTTTDQSIVWLDALSPLVIKLKRCIEVMCSRAVVGLTFCALQVTHLTFITPCFATLEIAEIFWNLYGPL